MSEELRRMIVAAASQLGISPVDLATAISYETGGTFDPMKRGPTTKWGQHRGLIQWGEPQAQKYLGGDFSIPRQGEGIVSYMRDAGVQPGMGMLDVYSAINAGSVGKYNASDTAAGGAPGSVRDKVEQQMAGHRRKAETLLGGQIGGMGGAGGGRERTMESQPFGAMAPQMQAPEIPGAVADYANAEDGGGPNIGKALSALGKAIDGDTPRAAPARINNPFGGDARASGNMLTQIMAQPTAAQLLLKKRLPYG